MDSSLQMPRRAKQMVWLQAKHLASEKQANLKIERALKEVK